MNRILSNTLGTWAILHHLSIKWDSMDICTANTEYKTVADFISKFFPCGGCASHFEEMYEMDRKGMVLAFRSFLLLLSLNHLKTPLSSRCGNFITKSIGIYQEKSFISTRHQFVEKRSGTLLAKFVPIQNRKFGQMASRTLRGP